MESTTDELLKKAYMEAIEQHGRVDLTYWKDTLLVKKLQSDEDSDLKKGAADKAKVKDEVTDDVKVKQEKDGSIPKRKVSAMGFVYPPAIDLGRYSKDNIKMEVGDSLFLDGDNGVVEDERESPKRRKDNNGVAVTPPQKVLASRLVFISPLAVRLIVGMATIHGSATLYRFTAQGGNMLTSGSLTGQTTGKQFAYTQA